LDGALLVAASVVAAIRLAREEDWSNSPRVAARISDSINLAKRIFERMKDEFPRSL
jgi:hypothetical protein